MFSKIFNNPIKLGAGDFAYDTIQYSPTAQALLKKAEDDGVKIIWKPHLPDDVAAQYNYDKKEIYLKNKNNFSSLCHELAHHYEEEEEKKGISYIYDSYRLLSGEAYANSLQALCLIESYQNLPEDKKALLSAQLSSMLLRCPNFKNLLNEKCNTDEQKKTLALKIFKAFLLSDHKYEYNDYLEALLPKEHNFLITAVSSAFFTASAVVNFANYHIAQKLYEGLLVGIGACIGLRLLFKRAIYTHSSANLEDVIFQSGLGKIPGVEGNFLIENNGLDFSDSLFSVVQKQVNDVRSEKASYSSKIIFNVVSTAYQLAGHYTTRINSYLSQAPKI